MKMNKFTDKTHFWSNSFTQRPILTKKQRGTKNRKKIIIKTNLERENPNKPPKEDGMTDTPLKMKKKDLIKIYQDTKTTYTWHSIIMAKSAC